MRAYGGPQFQVTQQVMNRFAEAIEAAKVDVVPRVAIGGSNGSGGSGQNLIEGLLAMLLSEKVGVQVTSNGNGDESMRPETQALRKQILSGLLTALPEQPVAAMPVPSASTTPLTKAEKK